MVTVTHFDKYLGKEFGKLKVLSVGGFTKYNKQGKRRTLLICKCSCNSELEVLPSNLTSKRVTACSNCNNCRKSRLTEEQRFQRKQELINYHKNYRTVNIKILSKKKREAESKIKLEGINHYGSKCTCCNEGILEFLTLEHILGRAKNDFTKSGKKITGKKMWAKAKSEGYPDIYTVLCFNCNSAKGIYGKCPHKN